MSNILKFSIARNSTASMRNGITIGSVIDQNRRHADARSVELSLMGERLPAEKALEWGLVNRVVPDHELFDTALAWARKPEVSAGYAQATADELRADRSPAQLAAAVTLYHFVIEATLISFAGGLLGVVLGFAMSQLIA